jgi:peptide/nickel transport system permease protein
VSAWLRLRRDRWSVAALVALAVVFFLAFFGGAIAARIVGHDGARPFPYATDAKLKPVGPWTRVPATDRVNLDAYGTVLPPPKAASTALMVLGADGPLGRDELIRVLDGARTSLEIAIGAVLVALLIAIPVGAIAGYFGGATDAVVSRFTETAMAFPLLLFLVFATAKLSPLLRGVSWSWVVPIGVFSEALLIGIFTSFYPTRLVRAQLLALRNAEFVESAQMIGASDSRILRRHLLPHLIPTLLVWSAIAVATNILLEVGLSFIGVGVQPSTPTWGSLLATAWGTIYAPLGSGRGVPVNQTPWQTIIPTAAILITVLSLNQVSEGIRRAIEPWSRR